MVPMLWPIVLKSWILLGKFTRLKNHANIAQKTISKNFKIWFDFFDEKGLHVDKSRNTLHHMF